MKLLYLIISLYILGLLTGCASSQVVQKIPASSITNQGPSVLTKSYRMSVGDQVQINVWKNPDLSIGEPIRPDGKISVALVGDVMAVGRTPAQLAREVEKKLSVYIKSPNVTVILTSLQGNEFLSRIRVTGAVVKNTSMPYHQGMTVLDAVLEAGSVDLYADANDTKLHRRMAKKMVTYDIHLKDILEDGDMRTNMILLPGDIITVPERNF